VDVSDHREQRCAEHAYGEAGEAHDEAHNGVGLQHFPFGEAAHLGDYPESGIVHPANGLGSAADGQRDVDWMVAHVLSGNDGNDDADCGDHGDG